MVGSVVAKKHKLSPGDSVISSPGSIFDPAGVYPLKMKIVGVLHPTGTPDDKAIFVDLKTTWIIEGIGHGHDEADKIGESGLLKSDREGEFKINASVEHYNEVTAENAKNFHFHGDTGEFPVTAAIVIPETPKARALYRAKIDERNDIQVILPSKEMDELFETVFRVQKIVVGILVLIGLATLGIGFLVFSLSHRLRISEFRNLSNMGADPALMRWLVAFEALFVLVASFARRRSYSVGH